MLQSCIFDIITIQNATEAPKTSKKRKYKLVELQKQVFVLQPQQKDKEKKVNNSKEDTANPGARSPKVQASQDANVQEVIDNKNGNAKKTSHCHH